jgi:microcystin-dependent protein
MANYEATKYDYNGSNIQGLVGVTTGSVIPWSSASIPSGFLECDGSNVSRTTYADLFATIGTTYGSGDGSTTFGLPDLADNIVVGKSNNKALASTGGANTVANVGNISGNAGNTTISTPLLPSHAHPGSGQRSNYQSYGLAGGGSQPRFPQGNSNTNATGGGGAHSHGLSANFTGSASSVLQPYLTVIYIIKT